MSKYYKDFGISKNDKKFLNKQLLYKLYKHPKKEKGVNMPHTYAKKENAVHQADLLFMPNDNGYRYILSVVDVATRKAAAEPIKSKKSDEIIEAFKKIYKSSALKMPSILKTDPGNEFKGNVKKYFEDNNVEVVYSLTGRHRQTAVVEALNKKIATALFKRMTAQELLTGDKSVEWVDDLPVIIKAINKNIHYKPPKADGPVCSGDSCQLLEIGTKVRRILDYPIDTHNEKRVHGKFRASDIRWHPEIRTIKNILLTTGQPPLYQLDDGKDGIDQRVAYTKQQLQVVDKNEELPPPKVIRGKPKTYKVEKIIGKKKIKGKIYYKVKWLGYPEEESTWEPRTNLIEDVPDLVKEYENK